MPAEIQEESDAQEYMNELQKIIDALSHQQQLSDLSSLKSKSTALDALFRRAQKVSNEAEGLKIIADINQKPLDQKADLDAIRKSVTALETAGETALERLKRLSNKTTAEAA